MRNLEYKTRVESLDTFLARAIGLGAVLQGELEQIDTYFVVPKGRFKLREIADRHGELIYYNRDEKGVDRASDYEVYPAVEPGILRDLLAAALGILATVRKRRTLLLLDGSRIHLDNVNGLGSFLELEVPVQGDDAPASERINLLLKQLNLTWATCIRSSYLDLVREM